MCQSRITSEGNSGSDSSRRFSLPVVDQNEESVGENAATPLDLSRQFLEEVDNLTAQLLDNVIRDVIYGEDASLDVVASRRESMRDTFVFSEGEGGLSETEASSFVEQLIDRVADPVETEELTHSAHVFLEHVLDQVSSVLEDTESSQICESSDRKVMMSSTAVVTVTYEEATLRVKTDRVVNHESEKWSEESRDDVAISLVALAQPQEEVNGDVQHSASVKVNSELKDQSRSNKKAGGLAFFVPADDCRPKCSRNKTKHLSATRGVNFDVMNNSEFESLMDGFLGELIHETLSMFNPLFQFYKAEGPLDNIDVVKCPIDSSNEQLKDVVSARPVVDVIVENERDTILERKVFDLKRWVCISRPQYKFSCGISSLVSCFNYLFSTLGNGDLPPVSQEQAMSILGFEQPFNQIRFGPFTGNETLKKWLKRLSTHFKVRSHFYYLYKPKGACTTSISEDDALSQLKEGLESTHTAFIYHCYNHYMCPIGFEVTPRFPEQAYCGSTFPAGYLSYPPETWIVMGDTSQKHPTLQSVSWLNIVLDLNCESPYHFNIRKPHYGVFKGAAPKNYKPSEEPYLDESDEISTLTKSRCTPEIDWKQSSPGKKKKPKNLHCIMAIKKLPPGSCLKSKLSAKSKSDGSSKGGNNVNVEEGQLEFERELSQLSNSIVESSSGTVSSKEIKID